MKMIPSSLPCCSHEAVVQCIWRATRVCRPRHIRPPCAITFHLPAVCQDFRHKIQNFPMSMNSVDQVNVNLRTNFLYIRRFGSFFFVHVTIEKLPKQRLYEKFVCKMLMKLTTGKRQFYWRLFVWKCSAQLFSNCNFLAEEYHCKSCS